MLRRARLALVLAVLCAAAAVPSAAADPPLPTPTVWPLPSGSVLRPFDPPAERWGRGHRGVDLPGAVGDPVRAAADGRVTYAGRLAGRGVVVVEHGGVRTTYEPVRALVAVGTRVRAGTPLGSLEANDHCGGRPCLHWGLKEGERYLDPLSMVSGTGSVRLLPATARVVAQRRAAARAATAVALLGAGSTWSGHVGRHGFLRPVPGGVTSPFGRRFHPILHVWKLHDGTDFAAPCGTPIRAAADGRVLSRSSHRAYGNRLLLDHGTVGGRRVVTGYNHAARYVVAAGRVVRRGEVIGYAGRTGYATGCHLHLMVWLDGGLTDPLSWM